MREAAKLSTEEFDAVYSGFTFEADFGSGIIELGKEGSTRNITKDNVEDYIRLYLEAFGQYGYQSYVVVKKAFDQIAKPGFRVHFSVKGAKLVACASSKYNRK